MSIPFELIGFVGLPVAMGIGLMYGLGPCLVSCLPYLGPVFLSSEGGIRSSWRILLPLGLGRLSVYGGFGAISGWWGQRYVDGVEYWVINLVIGMAALMVGFTLLLRAWHSRRQGRCQCSNQACKADPHPIVLQRRAGQGSLVMAPTMPFGLYLMGVGMALTPCAPMSVVLISAAATGSPWQGAALGLSFGLGAIIAPSLVYGLAVAYFGQRLREQLGVWLIRVEMLSATLFVLLGSKQVLSIFFSS